VLVWFAAECDVGDGLSRLSTSGREACDSGRACGDSPAPVAVWLAAAGVTGAVGVCPGAGPVADGCCTRELSGVRASGVLVSGVRASGVRVSGVRASALCVALGLCVVPGACGAIGAIPAMPAGGGLPLDS
jgi:hypothetical protein